MTPARSSTRSPDGDYRRRRRLDARRRRRHLRRGCAPRRDATTRSCSRPTCCHPSLANDNLSGIVAPRRARPRARRAAGLRHSYRLLWRPGTIGSLCWLAHEPRRSSRASATGSRSRASATPGRSRTSGAVEGTPRSTGAVAHVLRPTRRDRVLDWSPYGGDERQFCSPGFDLPVRCALADARRCHSRSITRRPTTSISSGPRRLGDCCHAAST